MDVWVTNPFKAKTNVFAATAIFIINKKYYDSTKYNIFL